MSSPPPFSARPFSCKYSRSCMRTVLYVGFIILLLLLILLFSHSTYGCTRKTPNRIREVGSQLDYPSGHETSVLQLHGMLTICHVMATVAHAGSMLAGPAHIRRKWLTDGQPSTGSHLGLWHAGSFLIRGQTHIVCFPRGVYCY
jgi:hypothetical protein